MASIPGYSTGTGGRTRSSDATSRNGGGQEQERASGAIDESDNTTTTAQSRPRSSEDAEAEAEVEAVLFNSTTREQSSEKQDGQQADATPGMIPAKPATPTITGNPSDTTTTIEPRKCWICYTDETEESPLNAEWRSPCPCALTAHEACLLDWLADIENPRARNRNGHSTTQLLCPQCKSEIVVSRPRSYVVDMVRFVERMAGRLVLPGVAFTLAGTVWAGCCAHGVYSMYFVFGAEEARRLFEESVDGRGGIWNPGLNLGLPFIPLVLIFSRTRYAEGLLPVIPVLFFASHGSGSAHESSSSSTMTAAAADLDLWPPSAAITFAALPYVKSFYVTLYERFFGKLERKWLAEVQPRAGEAESEQQQQQQQQQPDENNQDNNNEQILMEIDLELQVGLGRDEDDAQEHLGGPDGQNLGGGEGGGNGGGGGGGGGGQILGFGRGQNEFIADTSSLADTVLGALVFPAVSAGMGGILKCILPKSWTAATVATAATTASSSVIERGSSSSSRPGLLQTRWGRSVIGGCIFVLLKDALVLYCRWKLAQTHRKRRILNYDRKKKRVEGRR